MNDWTLLIDFGTSFSRVASCDPAGRVELIEVDGSQATSSGIWADPKSRLLAGLAARQQARLTPERWERAPGRLLGQGGSFQLGSTEINPVTAAAEVLRHLSAAAVARHGGAPKEVRLICPARWGEDRRAALLRAARSAGLGSPPLKGEPLLVEEPLAAAQLLADTGRLRRGGMVALFMIGGGSVEMSVLESSDDGFAVRALGGLDDVGGESFDDLLYQKVVEKAALEGDPELGEQLRNPPDAPGRRAAENLYREVRRAKEELSTQTGVTLDTGSSIGRPVRLDRVELDSVLRPSILSAAREFAATIERSGRRPAALDAVYLAGGSSRIPLVSRAIYDVLGVSATQLDDSTAVLGAAAWSPDSVIDLVALERSSKPVASLLAGVLPLAIPAAATSKTATPAPVRKTLPAKANPGRGTSAVAPAKAGSPPPNGSGAAGPADRNGSQRSLAGPAQTSAVATAERPEPAGSGSSGSGPSASGSSGPAAPDGGSPRKPAGRTGPSSPEGPAHRSPLRRFRWPIAAVAALAAVLGALALIGSASGQDAKPADARTSSGPVATGPITGPGGTAQSSAPDGSPGTDETFAKSSIPTPTVGTALPSVTGLSVASRGIAITLSWKKVSGADSYRVYRDAGTTEQASRTVAAVSFADRPGDDRKHVYSVVPLDDAGAAGAISPSVSASAKAPYGNLQRIASAWTAVIPAKPGHAGSAGQKCAGTLATSAYSIGKIVCKFPHGIEFEILRYPSKTERDHRFDQLAAAKGVSQGHWNVPLHGGIHSTGALLTAGAKASHGPWRWWTYDTAPTFGMYAQWPGHSAKQLAAWWNSKAPFRR